MLQIGGKYQHCAVLDSHDDLVGILGCELDHRWPDDPGLIAWVMEVDGVRAWMGPDVVHSAQEVVGVLVYLVRRASREDGHPAGGDLVRVVADPEESQNSRHDAVHARNEIPEVIELVE